MTKSSEIRRVKIGMLGSGTVGEAIQELVFNGNLPGRFGVVLELAKIYTREPRRKRWYPMNRALFTTNPQEVTDHPEVEIVVEVLGSQDERDHPTFKGYILRALQKGKSVVTSDKAVLARFGREILAVAQRYNQAIRFEACVGGGIPIIGSLTEGLSAEEPEAIYGIVNGTCNYILSEMKAGGKSYEEALREAQLRGYAETNPEADTSGKDAEAKIIILAAVTFGIQLEPGLVSRKGIEKINPIDFLYAHQKGSSTIKHLAVARNKNRAIEAFVSPMLVPKDHFLSTIDGISNAIFFKGKRSQGSPSNTRGKDRWVQTGREDWNYVFVGPGAGGGPTAVAILGDVCELARQPGPHRSAPGVPMMPSPFTVQAEDQMSAHFYVRFVVKDKSGIVGDICQTFGEKGINISEVWQLSHSQEELKSLVQRYHFREEPWQILPFVITVERTTAGQIKKALEIIRRKDFMLVDPLWLPIWKN
ncbi:MAG: homoserine dehydrogenase [Candidatus Binatia bacterium]